SNVHSGDCNFKRCLVRPGIRQKFHPFETSKTALPNLMSPVFGSTKYHSPFVPTSTANGLRDNFVMRLAIRSSSLASCFLELSHNDVDLPLSHRLDETRRQRVGDHCSPRHAIVTRLVISME